MKIKTFIYIILLVLCAACTKNEPATSGHLITMAAYEAGSTKALLEENTFMASGNELCIYDYYTPVSGTPYFYIDGATAQSNGSTWPFTGTNKYEWTQDGTHKFYGWMVTDNSNSTLLNVKKLFGTAENVLPFDKVTQTLTIPQTTLAQDSPQFDFMYSGITPREPAIEGFAPVSIPFWHLFTAFKITVTNRSHNKVTLKSVTIQGLKNNGSAVIDYQGKAPSVTYTAYDGDGTFTFEPAGGSQALQDNDGNAIVCELSDFLLMWPQSNRDLSNVKIILVYDYVSVNGDVFTDADTTIENLTLDSFEPGIKNVVGISFMDKRIDLTCTVEPWNKVQEMIDFSEQISVSTPLTWDETTVQSLDVPNGEVVLYSESAAVAVCNFHIDTPVGATWTASLIPVEGASDAFMIVDNTKYGVVGVNSQIKITVNNEAPMAPRHVAKLRITVQTVDGRTIVGNLMPKGTNKAVTEYKIIQNIING